jgi:hypothetical protein
MFRTNEYVLVEQEHKGVDCDNLHKKCRLENIHISGEISSPNEGVEAL